MMGKFTPLLLIATVSVFISIYYWMEMTINRRIIVTISVKVLKIHIIKCFRLKADVYTEAHELHFMVITTYTFFYHMPSFATSSKESSA